MQGREGVALSTPPSPLPSHAPRRGRARPLGWGQRGRAHPPNKGHAARPHPHHFMGTPRLEVAVGGPQPLRPYSRGGMGHAAPTPPILSTPQPRAQPRVFITQNISTARGSRRPPPGPRARRCRYQWTCSCTRRSAAAPRRPGPCRRDTRLWGYIGDRHQSPPKRPHRRQDERPGPWLHSRGVVGQVQGAGARGGLGHHVHLLRSWRKKGEKGQALRRGDTAGQDAETHPDLSG